MIRNAPTSIGPSIPKMLANLVLGNLLMAAGLLGIYLGLGIWVALVCAVPLVCISLIPLVSVVLGKPRVHIRVDGFDDCNIFRTRSVQWTDVEGDFAACATQNPIKLPGLGKMVVFNWTAAYGAQHGTKKTTNYGGYDTAISGAFQLSHENLAAILNEKKRAYLALASER